MVLDFFPGDKGVVCQEVRETEGFNVLLEARRYGPLVPPELVSLQIRPYRHKELLDVCELWVGDFGDLLAILSPLGHDTVEEKDEPLGVGRHISTSLGREKAERRGGWKSDDGSGFG